MSNVPWVCYCLSDGLEAHWLTTTWVNDNWR